jgi:hypothetical protein
MRWSGLSVPIVVVLAEPIAGVLARQPGSPADLQHLPEVEPIDGDDDVDRGQDAEAQQLMEKLVEILVLQGVVEQVVPLIEQNVEIDHPETHADDQRQQPARRPAFLGHPIGHDQLPQIAEEMAVGLFHGGWLPAGRQIRRHMGRAAALRNPGATELRHPMLSRSGPSRR